MAKNPNIKTNLITTILSNQRVHLTKVDLTILATSFALILVNLTTIKGISIKEFMTKIIKVKITLTNATNNYIMLLH